jgi:phage baseplate assembly protein gpV
MNQNNKPSQNLQSRLTMHFGAVTETNLADSTAKVKFLDLQGLESYWLPVLQLRAGGSSNSYWMPNTGENVVCLLDEQGEQGVVLGGFYNDSAPASATGADALNITTGTTTITSDVIIEGNVTITGDVSTTGNTSTTGAVTVTGSHAINGKETLVIGSTDTGGFTNIVSNQ